MDNPIVNPNVTDTTGRLICENDLVLLFNGNQDNKKWSLEKVVKSDEKLCAVFHKYLGPIYTDLSNVPSNWLVVVNSDESQIFYTDDFSKRIFG